MKRFEDWPARLQAVVTQYDAKPWEWGTSDCWCFASDAVRAVTGADFLGTYAGQYKSRLGALARVRGRGHRSFTAAAAAEMERIGATPVPAQFARVGDVAVTTCQTMCVRLAAGFVARGPDGKFYIAQNIERAWRVGE